MNEQGQLGFEGFERYNAHDKVPVTDNGFGMDVTQRPVEIPKVLPPSQRDDAETVEKLREWAGQRGMTERVVDAALKITETK